MNIFKNKKTLIVIILFIVAFVVYALTQNGSKSATGVKKQTVASGAVSTSGSVQPVLDGPGKEFVAQLLAIQNINFALDLFSDPVFQGLQDWSREIQQQEVGRPNPFAPLGDEGRIGAPATAEEAVANVAPAVKPATKTNTTKKK